MVPEIRCDMIIIQGHTERKPLSIRFLTLHYTIHAEPHFSREFSEKFIAILTRIGLVEARFGLI